ncbi:MAG: hypothetical protein KC713_01425 [Candidatus Omnitrophica bacterium]|nr:hypothetical protein [Candidatus Omnitrophota bacterium]
MKHSSKKMYEGKGTHYFPKKLITVIAILTTLVLSVLGWDIYKVYHNNVVTVDRSHKIQRLRTAIYNLDKKLSTNERAAIFTGEISWENRYREIEPQLDEAIEVFEKMAVYSFGGDLVNEDGYIRKKDPGHRLSTFHDSEVFLEGLRSIIVHLEEVLTITSRMAVMTEDQTWVRRYAKYLPHQNYAIQLLNKISPDNLSYQAANRIHVANFSMMTLTKQAFRYLDEGLIEDAKGVLFSEEYDELNVDLLKAVEKFNQHLGDSASIILKLDAKRMHIHIVFVVLAICFLLSGWLCVIHTFQKWEHKEQEHMLQLKNQSEALRQLNESLDQKVHERTHDLQEKHKRLKQTLAELNDAHESLKKAHVKLLHAEKMASIGQLAAGIAHEINNPIGFISSNLQTLQTYVKNFNEIWLAMDQIKISCDENNLEKLKHHVEHSEALAERFNFSFIRNDVKDLLEESLNGVHRVSKIIKDLRTFAREDEDKREMVHVNEIIESILGIVNNEIKYKATLLKDYKDIPPVYCNRQKLSQVFVNMLVNAAQSLEKKGTIKISTYEIDQFVCIEFSDTGCGIPPEKMDRIFDPFYTTKGVGQGTGLGLSICYDIIKLHEGDIKVSSRLGKGTVFTIMLPIKEKTIVL